MKHKELDIIYDQIFNSEELKDKSHPEKLNFFKEKVNNIMVSYDSKTSIMELYEFYKQKFVLQQNQIFFFEYNSLLLNIIEKKLVERPKYLEAFFYPNLQNEKSTLNFLELAQFEILISLFALTDLNLINTILALKSKNISIRIITDEANLKFRKNELNEFLLQGLIRGKSNLYIENNNKFIVIDRRVLLVGSYSWIKSENNSTKENCVIIENVHISKIFHEEFEKFWEQLPTLKPFDLFVENLKNDKNPNNPPAPALDYSKIKKIIKKRKILKKNGKMKIMKNKKTKKVKKPKKILDKKLMSRKKKVLNKFLRRTRNFNGRNQTKTGIFQRLFNYLKI